MSNYVFFWGCVIPNRLPFLEKSMRLVLDLIGIDYDEMEGFTCCPEKFLVETFSEEVWYLTAARNLALAERTGGDLLVACNGCYSTFRSAISTFHKDSKLREKVNRRLKEIGLEYDFRSSVYHVIEVLHDKVGVEVISRRVTRPLYDLNIGVHYGCQLVRPSPLVRIDDALKPVKLDRLVECLGANSIEYNTKMLCCGESMGRAGHINDSLSCVRNKLLDLEQEGVDALVVTCPACFMQYDTQQSIVQKHKEDLHIPVFYYTELLGLALGIDPLVMGLDMHRVSVQPFFDRWEELERKRASVPAEFDYDSMRTCVECESCSNDCPVTQVDDSFAPHDILRSILDGEIDEVLEGDQIWKCLECGTCVELCPNSFGMITVFKEAKRKALERGKVPPEIRKGMDLFKKTGVLGSARERTRSKLELGPVATSGGEELAKLLGDSTVGKDE